MVLVQPEFPWLKPGWYLWVDTPTINDKKCSVEIQDIDPHLKSFEDDGDPSPLGGNELKLVPGEDTPHGTLVRSGGG